MSSSFVEIPDSLWHFLMLCVIGNTGMAQGREKEINVRLSEEDCWDLRAKTELLKLPKIDKLLEILKIRPGMTILEIGVGTGQRACIIAEKLKGTGARYLSPIQEETGSII